MTEKQNNFIQLLVDQIGFRNSPYRLLYLSKILENCGGIEEASKLIKNLLAERQLRRIPTLKKITNQHIAVTDLSAFAFCPASYVVSETYDIKKTEQMQIGEQLHNYQHLQLFLHNLRMKRLRQIKEQQLKGEDVKKYLSKNLFGDLLSSEMIFTGHEQNKCEVFYSNDMKLAGVPDYIFQRPDKTKFVVEEKHTWQKGDISSPFHNHIIQILGYIYGLENLQLSYGYIIYFHYSWINGHLSTNRINLFRVIKSVASKEQLDCTIENVRSIKDGLPIDFDSANINLEKCIGCSVRALCNHKSGRCNILQFPYYKRQKK